MEAQKMSEWSNNPPGEFEEFRNAKKVPGYRPPSARRLDAYKNAPTEKIRASEEYLRTVPKLYRNLYLLASTGKASFPQAVKASCQMCMGYERAVPRIRDCSVHICPLWLYRPYQEGVEDEVLQDS
jgi:hypothetical protein